MVVHFAIVLAILGSCAGLPTPQGPPSSASDVPLPGPPGLRGSSALLGYDPNSKITTENTNAIQYQLSPGQTDTANLGTYLDFENNPNPQPIRGTKGGTDPGPRKFYSSPCLVSSMTQTEHLIS